MPIPEDKAEFLRGAGVTDESIEQINAGLTEDKKQADAEGLESKEETLVVDEGDPEPTETEPIPDATPVSRGEVEELARVVGEGLQALTAQISDLAGEVKQLKDKEDEPSLANIFQSAVGSPEAKQDGREALAKSKPQETEAKEEGSGVIASGNLLLNDMINGIVSGKAWVDFPGAEEVTQ